MPTNMFTKYDQTLILDNSKAKIQKYLGEFGWF